MRDIRIELLPLGDTMMAGIDIVDSTLYLNLNAMLKKTRKHGITMDEMIMTCISHEVIHQILFDMTDGNTSHQFDNICANKYPCFKYWIGGIGGAK